MRAGYEVRLLGFDEHEAFDFSRVNYPAGPAPDASGAESAGGDKAGSGAAGNAYQVGGLLGGHRIFALDLLARRGIIRKCFRPFLLMGAILTGGVSNVK